ncbi:MAG: hypothetical protein L0G87_04200 [Renibacterium salmoninarum]|nr:hypothetical protein [Renibacterium salmoninarum]
MTVLAVLLLVVLFPIFSGIWSGRGPWALLPTAILLAISWYLLERFASRQRQRTLRELAATGRFRCAIRWPDALPGSLREGWAPGVGSLVVDGFGFQYGGVTSEIPCVPREDRELLESLGRRDLQASEVRPLRLIASSIGRYRTRPGVLEICATAEYLGRLDAVTGAIDKSAP